MIPFFSRHPQKTKLATTLTICGALLMCVGALVLFQEKTSTTPLPQSASQETERQDRARSDAINTRYRASIQTIAGRIRAASGTELARELPRLADECKTLTLTSIYKDFHLAFYLYLQKYADATADTHAQERSQELKKSLLEDLDRIEKKFPDVFTPLSLH